MELEEHIDQETNTKNFQDINIDLSSKDCHSNTH